ncbi:MAG: DinB family protein [Aurantimonas endophytica]|uniref:Putative damage-inducible protein DinB n=1 Tax=Aurantimonas endophytica TaxID=1522175 RepID=A0A7W6H9Q0_9HYPH|nr:DinB family protein [Aurantimonas endophytica]MBB4001036.1 putative damage-inducible protein DinB [Aurantimonas endophytica]MCO6403308.1 DUF664 domain-containing protein [Aurantimonas endophytica]
MYHDTMAMFAGYNCWCNERLYAAADVLSDDEFRADRGVFFRSMLGTLNHILAADRIWMRRFTGAGDAPARLDAILYENRYALGAARVAEDARIADWIASLGETDLAASLSYETISSPQAITHKLAPALLHMFNHQTHHRGQAHAVLTGFGRDAPSLDLIQFQRETGRG